MKQRDADRPPGARGRSHALLSSLVWAGLLAACGADTSDARDAGVPEQHDHLHDAAPAADGGEEAPGSGAYAWPLPRGFPVPKVPDDNPLTVAKIELGRHLFYDERLSGNGTQSCASCHDQTRAFTDGRSVGIGSTGQAHVRSAMSLANVAYAESLTWANAVLHSLEQQALVPLVGEDPVELGLTGQLDTSLQRLMRDARYELLFAKAFPEALEPFSLQHVVASIASFERALISGESAYDRFALLGEADALGPDAERGMQLFFSERLECFHCHGGFNLSGATTHVGKAFDETTFHNDALYNLDGRGAYPADNTGLYAFTGDPADMGRFKAPTLRNIALTAPYMHDGSIATLEEVIEHYARGGRRIESGPNAGDGKQSPLKSELITGFDLSAGEMSDLLAFLHSLTDETFIHDERLADPFAGTANREP